MRSVFLQDLPGRNLTEQYKKKQGSGNYRILRRSLDARKKPQLIWNYRISTEEPLIPPDPEEYYPVKRQTGRGRAVV